MVSVAEGLYFLAQVEPDVPVNGLGGRGLRGVVDPGGLRPVDMIVLDGWGWRGLAGALGWNDDDLAGMDRLVDRWLMGADRRRLLDVADAGVRSGCVSFDDVAGAWLGGERVARLESLVRVAGFGEPLYPFCYALGRALSDVESAVGFVTPRRRMSDDHLGLVAWEDLP